MTAKDCSQGIDTGYFYYENDSEIYQRIGSIKNYPSVVLCAVQRGVWHCGGKFIAPACDLKKAKKQKIKPLPYTDAWYEN